MDAVFRLADTISVLVSGQVIACGTAEQIKTMRRSNALTWTMNKP
jgi:ABC-type branched-subunit amino acid transport system ATPase component